VKCSRVPNVARDHTQDSHKQLLRCFMMIHFYDDECNQNGKTNKLFFSQNFFCFCADAKSFSAVDVSEENAFSDELMLSASEKFLSIKLCDCDTKITVCEGKRVEGKT
jgi:hypothetical protein